LMVQPTAELPPVLMAPPVLTTAAKPEPAPAPKPVSQKEVPLQVEPVSFPYPLEAVKGSLTATATRYRIMLRVGDGKPMFEVRSGDELLMKVLCEKVDVKSPMEKGQSLSSVRATGKVRFVGFGAEGTCDELSFLAGSGEVQLNGGVKISVKDKLGRVETELTGDKINYRLDAASALTGGMKP
jgi:hypothetical protein